MTAATMDDRMTRLLREATDWRLVGLLFEYPGPGWRERVTAVAGVTGEPRLRAAAAAAQVEATEGMHCSIFGPGGPVSPREVAYLSGIQLGHLFAELNACYEAFGYHPATAEPSDHVSVEIGFLSYLALKQAYAAASGDEEHLDVTAEAAGRFQQEHLANLASPLATALHAAGPSYLALAAEVLRERTGPPARAAIPLTPLADDTDTDLTCG